MAPQEQRDRSTRDKRIGVWFSLVLGILILSGWGGWKLGGNVAAVWHGAGVRVAGNLPRAEREHLEAELSDLDAAQVLRVAAILRAAGPDQSRKLPQVEIAGIEAARKKVKTGEIKPVVDLYAGLAYGMQAFADGRDHNPELAARYMRSARPILQSLGWEDISGEATKAAALSSVRGRYAQALHPEAAK